MNNVFLTGKILNKPVLKIVANTFQYCDTVLRVSHFNSCKTVDVPIRFYNELALLSRAITSDDKISISGRFGYTSKHEDKRRLTVIVTSFERLLPGDKFKEPKEKMPVNVSENISIGKTLNIINET